MNDIKENILNNEITFIITSSNAKILSIVNLLNELSIKDNYKTTLFSFNISCNYYLQKLISLLSGINTNIISKYFHPYARLSKCNKDKIDRDKFINSIEKIQNSGILMNDKKYVADKDYIDYILDYSKNDVIIIDDFYALLEKTKYSLDEILIRVKEKKDTHLVLFMNKINKEKMLRKFENVLRNYIFIDGYNNSQYKDIEINIMNKIIKLRFDKFNQIIMEEKNEGKLCNN